MVSLQVIAAFDAPSNRLADLEQRFVEPVRQLRQLFLICVPRRGAGIRFLGASFSERWWVARSAFSGGNHREGCYRRPHN